MYQSIADIPSVLQTTYVETEQGCWTYTGAQKQKYPVRPDELGGNQFTHRWIYESIWGELPKYKRIVHTCGNTRCINPWHMNLKYNLGQAKGKAHQRGDTAKCGHPFNDTDRHGWRMCNLCNRKDRSKWKERQRQTHSKCGHKFNDVDRNGYRTCNICYNKDGSLKTMDNEKMQWRRWPGRQAARKRILERDGNVCYYCHGVATTVDHVIAQATWLRINGDLDGVHDDSNLVAACLSCNSSKQAQSAGSFLVARVLALS